MLIKGLACAWRCDFASLRNWQAFVIHYQSDSRCMYLLGLGGDGTLGEAEKEIENQYH